MRLGHPVLPAPQQTPPRASPKEEAAFPKGTCRGGEKAHLHSARQRQRVPDPPLRAVTGSLFSVELASEHNDVNSYLASKAPFETVPSQVYSFYRGSKGRTKLEFILWNLPHSGSVICVLLPHQLPLSRLSVLPSLPCLPSLWEPLSDWGPATAPFNRTTAS